MRWTRRTPRTLFINDAGRLSRDPNFGLIGSEKIWVLRAAPTSRLQAFETEMLAQEENFAGGARLNRALIGEDQVYGVGRVGAHKENLCQGGPK
jgi:hypothetical protein